MLAVYSGTKLPTARPQSGTPVLAPLWAATRRIAKGTSPFRADRKHFHHLLLDAGMSQRQAVLTLYAIAIGFGTVALLVGSFAKMVALIALTVLMAAAIAGLVLYKWFKSRRLIPK